MAAAALGRRRTESVDDLNALRFGVRIDQAGTLIKDHHTVMGRKGSLPMSSRYYLADAVFVVGLQGDRPQLEAIATALESPRFDIHLGRRCCAHTGPLVLGCSDEPLVAALHGQPWTASAWFMKKAPHLVSLDVAVDAEPGDEINARRPDNARSFNSERRQYSQRAIHYAQPVEINNPLSKNARLDTDFMSTFTGDSAPCT